MWCFSVLLTLSAAPLDATKPPSCVSDSDFDVTNTLTTAHTTRTRIRNKTRFQPAATCIKSSDQTPCPPMNFHFGTMSCRCSSRRAGCSVEIDFVQSLPCFSCVCKVFSECIDCPQHVRAFFMQAPTGRCAYSWLVFHAGSLPLWNLRWFNEPRPMVLLVATTTSIEAYFDTDGTQTHVEYFDTGIRYSYGVIRRKRKDITRSYGTSIPMESKCLGFHR